MNVALILAWWCRRLPQEPVLSNGQSGRGGGDQEPAEPTKQAPTVPAGTCARSALSSQHHELRRVHHLSCITLACVSLLKPPDEQIIPWYFLHVQTIFASRKIFLRRKPTSTCVCWAGGPKRTNPERHIIKTSLPMAPARGGASSGARELDRESTPARQMFAIISDAITAANEAMNLQPPPNGALRQGKPPV